MEILDVDTPSETAGRIIELVGTRRGEMKSMETHGNRTLIEFTIPTRGIIGLRSKLMTASGGEAIVAHRFDHYARMKGEITNRTNGVLVSMSQGEAVAYAIDALQLRGIFFISPGTPVYEGMIVAEHCKEGDLVVNLRKSKQLTNVRSSSSDKALKIAPPRILSLEETLEYIADDELVEVTPKSIRMRKRFLSELDRKRNRSR
jgi:GTP-binding protein